MRNWNRWDRQVAFTIFTLAIGIPRAIAALGGAAPTDFSVSNKVMHDSPKASQALVERELEDYPALAKCCEMRARYILGSGFEANGNLVTAEKNYKSCLSLQKIDTSGDNQLFPKCMNGLAAVEGLSAQGLPVLNWLYSLREGPEMKASKVRVDFYFQLIGGFSAFKDFSKCSQLISELNAGILHPDSLMSKTLLEAVIQGPMLIRKMDLKGARMIFDSAKKGAAKLNYQWITGLVLVNEAKYFIAVKDFKQAKKSFENGYKLKDPNYSDFNRFWMDYTGLMVGFYAKDKEMVARHYTNCAQVIRGTEVEKQLSPLISAWRLLSESKSIQSELAILNEVFGPSYALVDELKAAAGLGG